MKNIVLIFFCLLLSRYGLSMVYYVNDNSTAGDVYCLAVGNNSNTGTSPSTPKLSLTNFLSTYSAILTSGDAIYVDAGTYSDVNLTLNFNGISIIGAGPAKTIFDNNFASSDANRLFNITGSNILLQGFCVTEYNYGVGGATAIQISGASNLTLNNVLIDENRQGGGSSTIVINGGSTVTFNGGGSNCNSQVSVAGGGVNVEGNGNTVTFNNYSFSNNSKDYQGGSGLYIVGNNTTSVLVNNSIFADNRNTSDGGAIYITGSNLTVNNSCLINNSTFSGSGPKYGGAVTVGRGATITFSNCRFENNAVSNSGNGGAIAINTQLAGAGTTATVNINTCSFTGNTSNGSGHHLYARVGSSNPAVFNVNNCTFSASGQDIKNGGNTATINVQNSGNPSTSGTINFINSNAPSSTAATGCPILQGSCYGTILPVELSSFTGKCLDGMGALTWTTDTEYSNAYFTIERSRDDNDYSALSIINGAINTTKKTEYRFLDTEMQKGTNYYRLSQTDLDGQTRILKTIAIENNCFGNGLEETAFVVDAENNQVLLLMNVEHKVNFEFTLTDNMGRLLLHKDLTADPHQNKVTILLPDSMAAGVYHLTVTDGSIRVNNKVFMNK